MITVIESAIVYPVPRRSDQVCLYTRRDVFPDGSYQEFSYVGPEAEVAALAQRCLDVDMSEVDACLRRGLTFEAALEELGA
jgi:hypothetical protein